MRFIIIFILFQYNANALHRVCFSPNDGVCSCEKNIIEMLDLSTKTVDLGIYALNNKNITNAIVNATKRGIKIRAVYDRSQSTLSAPFLGQLKDAGVECYYNHVHKIEHNKFIIIDNQIVMNGSFNFTETAEHKNSENCTIHDNINVVKAFSDRFEYLFDLYKKRYIIIRDKKEKETIDPPHNP